MKKHFTINLQESYDDFNDTSPENDVDMRLKPNHQDLPYWVCTNLHIIIDISNPLSEEVSEFINRIAEVKSRMNHIHEYCISDTTLNKAMSFGMDSEMICETLDKYSKNYLSDNVRNQIMKIGRKENSFKLVLSQGKYYVQCEHSEQLTKMKKKYSDYFIGNCMKIEEGNVLYKELDLKNEVYLIERLMLTLRDENVRKITKYSG